MRPLLKTHLVLEGGEPRVQVLAGRVDLGGRPVALSDELVGAVVHVLQLRLRRGDILLKGSVLALRSRERLGILCADAQIATPSRDRVSIAALQQRRVQPPCPREERTSGASSSAARASMSLSHVSNSAISLEIWMYLTVSLSSLPRLVLAVRSAAHRASISVYAGEGAGRGRLVSAARAALVSGGRGNARDERRCSPCQSGWTPPATRRVRGAP